MPVRQTIAKAFQLSVAHYTFEMRLAADCPPYGPEGLLRLRNRMADVHQQLRTKVELRWRRLTPDLWKRREGLLELSLTISRFTGVGNAVSMANVAKVTMDFTAYVEQIEELSRGAKLEKCIQPHGREAVQLFKRAIRDASMKVLL